MTEDQFVSFLYAQLKKQFGFTPVYKLQEMVKEFKKQSLFIHDGEILPVIEVDYRGEEEDAETYHVYVATE